MSQKADKKKKRYQKPAEKKQAVTISVPFYAALKL